MCACNLRPIVVGRIWKCQIDREAVVGSVVLVVQEWLKRWIVLGLLCLLLSGIANLVVPTEVSADSRTSITLDGNFFGPTFGPSNEFFYAAQVFEETVNDAGVLRSNFLKIRVSDLGIVSSTRVEFPIHGLSITSNGTYAFGSTMYGAGNRIAKINLNTMAVTEIQITSLDAISRFEIDSNGTYGYATGNKYVRTVNEIDFYNNYLVKINLDTGTTLGTLGLLERNHSSPQMYGIALHEAQNFGCAVDNYQGILQGFRISPFDFNSGIAESACGSVTGVNPVEIEFDRSKRFGYLSAAADKKLLKFDLDSGELLKFVAFPNYTSNFRINPASTFAYVSDEEANPSFLYKVSLSTFEIVEQVPLSSSSRDIAISPNGLVGVVLASNGLIKISLSASAPQNISFVAPTSNLTGARTVVLQASSSSTLPVTFSSVTQSVCTVAGAIVSLLNEGDCTIVASQDGSALWDPAPSVSRTFKVFLSPPGSNTGISISGGKPFSNSKNVFLEINWPEFASAVRLSNDGGFGNAVTVTKRLSPTTTWELDDSVKGVYTKVVYARFVGEGIDATKTFSDDIILDTTAPSINSASASLGSGSVKLGLLATDDISGLDKVEVKTGSQIVSREYGTNLTLNTKELTITTASALVRKLSMPKIEVRISDKAGNWSAFKTVSVSQSSAPALSSRKSASAASIAAFAKLKVASTSKVSLRVVSNSSKFCRVSGASLKGLKAGSCKVTVTVKPKKGKVVSKTVTLKVLK